ncbi:MAG: hypothetical protein R2708_02810 [Vicinamibacterales bacterium]
MAEGQLDIAVERWSCSVTNQHRKAYGDRKIRQRTVIRLEGAVSGTAEPQPAVVFLNFERGAQDFAPTATIADQPEAHVQVDAYLQHGQEAAALAILQSGFKTWARFHENALGQTSFVLESGGDAGLVLPA